MANNVVLVVLLRGSIAGHFLQAFQCDRPAEHVDHVSIWCEEISCVTYAPIYIEETMTLSISCSGNAQACQKAS